MKCTLQKKAWLYRQYEIETPEGRFKVEYDGRGMGFESVLVEGQVAERRQSLVWFEPTFEFVVGSLPAQMEVRVWAWFQIKSIKIIVAECELFIW